MTPALRFQLAAFAALALGAIAFYPLAADLAVAWEKDEYSHGYLILPIALLIAWHRLAERKPAPSSSWWGPALALASLLLLAVGVFAAFQAAMGYGAILFLTGMSLAFLGMPATRALAPALIYLLFAIPLPHLLHTSLSQDLQLISSTIGVWVLDLFRVSVFQEGNIIDLGGYKLQVVDACSGLRYLFPLMSFGYLVALLMQDRMWKRVLVFLSTIPITILMNSLRISLIGFTVQMWGQEMAEGLLHEFEGWVVFLICVLILLAEAWLLMGSAGRVRIDYLGPAQGPMLAHAPRLAKPMTATLAAAALMAAVFGADLLEKRPEILPPHPPFAAFPLTIESWQGRALALDTEVLQGLKLSDYWLADYRKEGQAAPVNFYLAYYASQRIGTAAHSPADCIPGGGWRITKSDERDITLASGASLRVARFLIRRGEVAQLVYYWFDERGRNLTGNYQAKWYLLVDALALHRTDGALIRYVTPLAPGEREEQAEARLLDFLNASHPEIGRYVPGRHLPSDKGMP